MPALWEPTEERIELAQVTRFTRFVEDAQPELSLPDYNALYQWSVAEPAMFWQAVWDYCDVKASATSRDVLLDGDKMPGAQWFPDARLNFAENLLARRDDALALVSLLENGARRAWGPREQVMSEVVSNFQHIRQTANKPGSVV